MNIKIYIKWMLFVVVFILLLQSTAMSQNNLPLESITFSGNDSIPAAELSRHVVLKKNNFFRKMLFWKDRHLFNQNIMTQDIRRLQVFYQTEGFLKTLINPQIETDEQNKKVFLSFNISENQPVIVNEVKFILFSPDSIVKQRARGQIELIRHKILLTTGTRFRDESLTKDEKLLKFSLLNDGFPFAKIETQLKVGNKKEKVDIYFNLKTGPRCVFGDIEVIGNEKTGSKSILRQVALKKGKIYSEEKLRKTQEQIFQLGVFNYVTVRSLLKDSVGNAIPVEANISESPLWTTKFGVGYGKEDRFRTFIEFRKNGLWGSPRRIVALIKYSDLEPYNLNLKWIKPAFIYSRATLILNPFFRKQKEPAFTVIRVGGNITYQQQLATFTDGYINYTLEQDQLDISQTTRLQGLGGQDFSIYNKSSLTIGLARDKSTPAFSPTSGSYSAGSFTYSGLGFNNNFRFMRSQFEERFYHKLWDQIVMAARIKIGAMKTTRGDLVTPIEERFYAGGSYSVRGWARSELGPQNSEGIPIGGNSLLESSLEVRFPVWNTLSGVVFMDAGNVWSNINYDPGDLYYATGAGLRFKTPIGPIRFDIARPVFKSSLPLQFHISIGQAF